MKLTLKAIVTLALIAVIVWYVGGVREIGQSLAGVGFGYLALAFAVMTLDRLLMTYKWSILLSSHGVRLTLLRGCQIYCTSMIWGLLWYTAECHSPRQGRTISAGRGLYRDFVMIYDVRFS